MSPNSQFQKFNPLLSLLKHLRGLCDYKVVIFVSNYEEYEYLEAMILRSRIFGPNGYFVSWTYTPDAQEIAKYDLVIEYPGWYQYRTGNTRHLRCLEEFTKHYYPFELL